MKQPIKQPPTAAQLAIWHGLQSVFQAAVISVCVGAGQYLVTGNVSVNGLLTVLCASFAGAGSMIYKSVSANPQLAQAALDTAQEALQKIEQAAPWLARDIMAMQKTQTPIVFPPQGGAASIPVLPAQQSKQQQSGGGGGAPADYYTRNYNVVTRQSVADMSTQGYPAVQQAPQQQFTGNNQVPPAMSFLQENRPQQGG